MKIIWICTYLSCLLVCSTLSATTIRPYVDLGEMAKSTSTVVLVEMMDQIEHREGEVTHFRMRVLVKEVIKGKVSAGHELFVQNLHKRIGNMERTVWGDLQLEKGNEYLLFLERHVGGYWIPKILSYGALQAHEKDGDQYLAPVDLGGEMHILSEGDVAPEKLGVYHKSNFLSHVKSVIAGEMKWDRASVTSTLPLSTFIEEPSRDVENPGHCTHLSGAPLARWQDLDINPLPIYYAAGGDPGCTGSVVTHIQNSIQAMNAQYTGVSLSMGGTHGFVPSCSSGQGATDGEFTSWVSSNIGQRSLAIQFDDPCNEIGDLNGCNGTIAVGGLYWFSSTYEWSGVTWRSAAYGYVIVNNGTGACMCQDGDDYEIMLTHEMTHALNMGHIGASEGPANMNPSCCTDIQTLDVQCLNYVYAEAVLPIELSSFDGQSVDQGIEIEWETRSEIDNDFFVLERSIDGSSFEEIVHIQGAGESYDMQAYQYLDADPYHGKNYYRLKQVDVDGSENYVGGILALNHAYEGALSIQPNIIGSDILRFRINTEDIGKDLHIVITDASGQALHTVSGMIPGKVFDEINVGTLGSGMYFLHVLSKGIKHTARFVKL